MSATKMKSKLSQRQCYRTGCTLLATPMSTSVHQYYCTLVQAFIATRESPSPHCVGCHNQSELGLRARDQACLSDHSCLYILDTRLRRAQMTAGSTQTGLLMESCNQTRTASRQEWRRLRIGCMHASSNLDFTHLAGMPPAQMATMTLQIRCTIPRSDITPVTHLFTSRR